MSYVIMRVYSFDCDYPDCGEADAEVLPYENSGLRGAVKDLRALRWTVRSGMHFCPKHTATQIALVVAERLSKDPEAGQ